MQASGVHHPRRSGSMRSSMGNVLGVVLVWSQVPMHLVCILHASGSVAMAHRANLRCLFCKWNQTRALACRTNALTAN